ncbi:MAG: J domain-containing protein [Flavobacteriales bacterium]
MAERLNYDHYKVLGVRKDASSETIKRAYRDRVKQCHPDVNASPGAHTRFLVVSEAYNVLSDPYRRMIFDHQLVGHLSKHVTPKATDRRRKAPHQHDAEPDRSVPYFAFVGLHLTGLIFGVSIVLGVMAGYTLLDWPAYVMLLTVPGVVVIPDSIEGLRIARRSAADRS